MSGFHSASDFVKLGFFLVIGTWCFLFIIFFAPYWTTRYNGYAGLWQGCTDGLCYDRWNMWVEEYVKATQGFVILSLICTTAEALMIIFFIFHRNYEADRRLLFFSVINSGLTSFFMFLAICIWAGGQYMGSGETLNWCYVFACVTVISAFVSGFLFVMELRAPLELGEDQENLILETAKNLQQQQFAMSQSVLTLKSTTNSVPMLD